MNLLWIVVTSFCCASAGSDSPKFEVIFLDRDLPLDTQFFPSSINNGGYVAGFIDAFHPRACVWMDGNTRVLESYRLFPEGGAQAEAIAESGSVAGLIEVEPGIYHAGLWPVNYPCIQQNSIRVLSNSISAPIDLGTLGGTWSAAYDVNSRNVVVGQALTEDNSNHAFVWRDGIMSDLLPDSSFSVATAINESGLIVGFAEKESGNVETFVMESSSKNATFLGTLGGNASFGMDLNERGDVVGCSYTKTGRRHAFIWKPYGHVMHDLGTLGDDPSAESFAVAVNNFRVVVGYSVRLGFSNEPCIWVNGEIRSINDCVEDTFRGRIEYICDINAQGEICGIAEDESGQDRAVLLCPIKSN